MQIELVSDIVAAAAVADDEVAVGTDSADDLMLLIYFY